MDNRISMEQFLFQRKILEIEMMFGNIDFEIHTPLYIQTDITIKFETVFIIEQLSLPKNIMKRILKNSSNTDVTDVFIYKYGNRKIYVSSIHILHLPKRIHNWKICP